MKVDYQKTFIYKLCCRDFNVKDIYIGHSTNFKQRNQGHKTCCNNINSKEYNLYKNRFIRENGGYNNWIMIKLYDFPCNSKREAEAEETKTMIELNATLNSVKSFQTEEEKKTTQKECSKEYYENNKTEISEKKKVKYENNKTEISEKNKKYYNDNKTEILEKQKVKSKEYYENNKPQILEKLKINVKCEFCGCEIRKDSLKRHQKTLKCMKFQEFIDV